MKLKPEDMNKVIELMRQIIDALQQPKFSSDEQQKNTASKIPPLRRKLNLFLVPRWDEIWPYTTQASENPHYKVEHRAYGNVKYNLQHDIEDSFLMETSDWYHYATAVDKAHKKIMYELECVKTRLEYEQDRISERIKVVRDSAKLTQTQEQLAEKGQDTTPAKSQTWVKETRHRVFGLVIFFAALLTIFYYLGWLEPIKEFIKKILWTK